jgi:hypothetical protein
VAAVLVLAFPSSAGADLYVAPAGSASGSCAQTAPCTVARADELASPGSTVVVLAGKYGAASLNASGTAGARVHWISAERWGAHFPSVSVNGHFIDIEGFDVGDSTDTILLNVVGNYSRALGNHVHEQNGSCDGNGAAGIEAQGWQDGGYNGHDQEIVGNLVEDIGVGPRDGTCALVHGIYTAVPHVTVANNIVRRALGAGIHAWHAAADNTWVNNTVVDNGWHGLVVGNGDTGGSVGKGFYVANNVATGNMGSAVAECCSSSVIGPNTYVNNLGWANRYAPVLKPQNGGTEVGSLNADPLFVNYFTGDYRLRPKSPAVDSGTPIHAPSADYAGTPRPQGAGFDRGALELVMPSNPKDPATTRTPSADDIGYDWREFPSIARMTAER